VQVFLFRPNTMYDFFTILSFAAFFFNSLYYLFRFFNYIVNVEFSSFIHCLASVKAGP
jgi:hypothetical protein